MRTDIPNNVLCKICTHEKSKNRSIYIIFMSITNHVLWVSSTCITAKVHDIDKT